MFLEDTDTQNDLRKRLSDIIIHTWASDMCLETSSSFPGRRVRSPSCRHPREVCSNRKRQRRAGGIGPRLQLGQLAFWDKSFMHRPTLNSLSNGGWLTLNFWKLDLHCVPPHPFCPFFGGVGMFLLFSFRDRVSILDVVSNNHEFLILLPSKCYYYRLPAVHLYVVLELELRAVCILGGHSIAWANIQYFNTVCC